MSEHYRQKPTIDILPKETVTAGTIVVTSAGEQTLDPHHFNATTFTVPDDVRLDPSVDAALIEWLREDAPHPLYAVAESSPEAATHPLFIHAQEVAEKVDPVNGQMESTKPSSELKMKKAVAKKGGTLFLKGALYMGRNVYKMRQRTSLSRRIT